VRTNNNQVRAGAGDQLVRPEPFLNRINANGVITGYNPAAGGFTSDLNFPVRSTSYGLTIPPFGGYQVPLSATNNGGLSLGLAFLNDIQVYMFLEAARGTAGERHAGPEDHPVQRPDLDRVRGRRGVLHDQHEVCTTSAGSSCTCRSTHAFPIGQG